MKIFTPYTELRWMLAFFFMGMLIGCSESEKIPATQGASKSESTKYLYEDEFVRIQYVEPDKGTFKEYWITEDKATGARVITFYRSGSSAVALSSCPLPPLSAQPLEAAKK